MNDETKYFLLRQKKCLALLGHSSDLNQRRESVPKKIQQLLIVILIFTSLHPIINYAIYNKDNIDLLTASLSYICIVALNTIKILTLLINKKAFLEIMAQLEDMWKNNSEVLAKKRLKKVNTFWDRIINYYFYVMIWTSLISFIISPLIKLIWALITHQTYKRQWISPMRFFFSVNTSPGYELALIYIACVSIPAVINMVAVDALFVSFTANICAHFGLLQHFIEKNEFTETDTRIGVDIISFVKYHTQILELAKKICKAYKPIIFAQFLMTSLQVCVIVYQISKHMDNVLMLFANISFLCTIMIQLLVYCYGGEFIKLESLKVATSVQQCKWYRLQPQYRKMLSLLILRSQRAIIFRSGFYDASLASFMLIIKAASSYITLIQSLE